MFGIEAAAFVGVSTVVADSLLSFGRDVLNDCSDEIDCGENFEVLLGVPTALGSVDDFLGAFVSGHFL